MKAMPDWFKIPFYILIGLIVGAAILLIARQPSGQPILLEPKPSPAPIRIHVDGAVNSPGVYSLPSGTRVEQAVASAGGLTDEADTTNINLAVLLVDGQKIYIPKLGQPIPDINYVDQTEVVVNLNTAPLESLITLPGIGEDRAKSIIEYRENNGGFKSIEEIQNIEGIGPATFEKLKDRIVVNPAP